MKIENPFHEGELQVQERAGVRAHSRRAAVVISDSIVKGALAFIGQQSMVVLGSLDEEQNTWSSIVTGVKGFIQATTDQLITVDLENTTINERDPFWKNIEVHPKVGMLIIELATRRRLRVNATLIVRTETRLELKVLEAYPNCPKYIQRRNLQATKTRKNSTTCVTTRGILLGDRQAQIIQKSDTLFVATAHPERGLDASHRGGKSGFVRVLNNKTLLVPDYQGNNLFNSLGNMAVNPRTGLAFLDFESGTTLQLTGRSEILWDYDEPDIDSNKETGGTRRFWKYTISSWLQLETSSGLEWQFVDYSPYNPT